jgi:hypothetical protein
MKKSVLGTGIRRGRGDLESGIGDGFERACFLDSPSGREGDTRSLTSTTSARRKSRTTRDDEPETFSLPDEEPEGWAVP